MRPLPNLSQQPLHPRDPRTGPHQQQPKLRQPLRRKNPLPRQLRHQLRLRHSNLPPLKAVQMQHWRPGSLRTKLPQKPVAQPTQSCGSTYRRRSITSQERRVTAPQSAAPTCARRTQLLLKTERRRPRDIPEVRSKESRTKNASTNRPHHRFTRWRKLGGSGNRRSKILRQAGSCALRLHRYHAKQLHQSCVLRQSPSSSWSCS